MTNCKKNGRTTAHNQRTRYQITNTNLPKTSPDTHTYTKHQLLAHDKLKTQTKDANGCRHTTNKTKKRESFFVLDPQLLWNRTRCCNGRQLAAASSSVWHVCDCSWNKLHSETWDWLIAKCMRCPKTFFLTHNCTFTHDHDMLKLSKVRTVRSASWPQTQHQDIPLY